MVEDDTAYFRRRAAEEARRAEDAGSVQARAVHAALAERYRQKLDAVRAPAVLLRA